MLGFGKKKEPEKAVVDDRIRALLAEFETLNAELSALYQDFERYSPAEIHLFSMAAISVYLQSYVQLPEKVMQATVITFTEQAVAMTLANMPRADFHMVYNAARDRFSEYADMIVDLDGDDPIGAAGALLGAIDAHAKVQRDEMMLPLIGGTLLVPLTNCAANVRDAYAT